MKKQKWLVALLSTVCCVCSAFGFAEIKQADAAESNTVTVEQMIQNSVDLRPAFNYGGNEKLSVDAAGAISCWSDGHFFYCEEVDSVALDITFTAGTDICFALRTDGGGQMWTSHGYYAFVYQGGAGAVAELYKVTDCGAWQTAETQLAKGEVANIFDGNAHSITYNFDETTGALSFTVGNVTIAGTDSGTPIAKTNSNFKIARVNSGAMYKVSATKSATTEPTPEPETAGIALTDEIMLKNPNKLLPAFNYGGAERLAVENGQISSWSDGNFFYNDLVDSASFTFTAGAGQSMLFVGLHLNSVAVPWASTGYYAFIQGNVVGLYKIDSTNISNWESGLLGDKVTCSSNIFDGAEHKVTFAVKGNELFIQINEESMTLAFAGNAIPVDGTEFGLSSNGTGTFFVGESTLEAPIVEVEYTGEYTNMETLIASGAIRPDYNYDSVANNFYCKKENGFVYSNDVKMSISATVTAIDFDIVVTGGSSMFFGMRATRGGNIWETDGYAVWLDKTTLKLFDLSESWHDAPNKMVENVVNIYDGKQHNIKMYAYDDANGYVQVGFAIDNGEFVKFVDTTAPSTLANHTEVWLKSVNDESVRFQVTAPANTVHAYGEPVVTAPTCTEGGYTKTVCADCGKTVISDEMAATGHSYESVVTAPTCLANGYTTYTCACGDTYQEEGEAALGHSHESVVTAPTCEEGGYTTYTCACGDSYMDSFEDELGHDLAAATCTEAAKCQRENCEYTEGEALGHSHGDWVVVKEATTTEAGERVKTCACGDEIREEIPVIEDTTSDETSDVTSDKTSNVTSDTASSAALFGCGSSLGGLTVGALALCVGAILAKKKED